MVYRRTCRNQKTQLISQAIALLYACVRALKSSSNTCDLPITDNKLLYSILAAMPYLFAPLLLMLLITRMTNLADSISRRRVMLTLKKEQGCLSR